MANVGVSAVKIIDNDSDVVSVTSNRLDVNATLVAGATIDIGDVDMFLDGGTAILGGAGDIESGVLRVTIAADDILVGSIATAIKAEDVEHGRHFGERSGDGDLPRSEDQSTTEDLEQTSTHHENMEDATIQDNSLHFEHLGGSRSNFDNNFISINIINKPIIIISLI